MKDRTGGFALIELIASLVILSMISVLMISGVVTGRRVWERLDANNAMGESIAGAQTVLHQRLERTYPATRYDSNPPYSDFDGAASTITFLAEPRASVRPAALMRYEVALSGDDLALIGTNDVASDPKTPTESQILLHGVQSVDMEYYGPGPDGTPGWQLRWKEQQSPPQLIRIRVQFAAGDGRQWPDLLIKPAANIDTLCVLNAQTGKCRGRA